jgi:hypothetical protein
MTNKIGNKIGCIFRKIGEAEAAAFEPYLLRNDKKQRSSEPEAAQGADVAAAGARASCRGQTLSSQTTAHPGHAKTLSP